jgi:hypothetical protein
MKTSSILSSLVVTFLIAGFTTKGIANDYKPVTVSIEQKIISIYIDGIKPKEVEIRMVDREGEVLMTDFFNTEDFKKRNYNLINLPDGTYKLEINDVQKTITMMLRINSDILEIEKEESLYKPHSFFQEQKWNLSVMSMGNDVNVRIVDQTGNLVYEEEIIGQLSIQRRYNLSKLNKGSYTFYVYMAGNAYEQGQIRI